MTIEIIHTISSWTDGNVEFSIDDALAGDLDDALASTALLDAFDAAGYTLTAAAVGVITAGDEWVVGDKTSPTTGDVYTLEMGSGAINVTKQANTFYVADLRPGDVYFRAERAPGPMSSSTRTIPRLFRASDMALVGEVVNFEGIHAGPETAGFYDWWYGVRAESLGSFAVGAHFVSIVAPKGVSVSAYMRVEHGVILRGVLSGAADDMATNSDYDGGFEGPYRGWNQLEVQTHNDFAPLDIPLTGGSGYLYYIVQANNFTAIANAPAGSEIYSQVNSNALIKMYDSGVVTAAPAISLNKSGSFVVSPGIGGAVYLYFILLHADSEYTGDPDGGGDPPPGDDDDARPNLVVHRNIFGAASTAAVAASNVLRLVVENNNMQDCAVAVSLDTCHYARIADNVVAAATAEALQLATCYYPTLTDNVLRDAAGATNAAIMLQGVQYAKIAENRVTTAGDASIPTVAVTVDVDCVECAIVNNDFRYGYSTAQIQDNGTGTYAARNLPETDTGGGGGVGTHTHDIAIDDLTDVNATGPLNGYILAYSSTLAKWVAQPHTDVGAVGELLLDADVDLVYEG
jgi:hypothetical protein